MTADDRPLHELTHAELVDRCQRLANAFVANQKRIQADLEPILRTAKADAWDEGHEDGQSNEHEFRPGRKITNPYREDDQ